MRSERNQQGLGYLRAAQGDDVAGQVEASLREISSSYADFSIASTYGEVFQRDGLELRLRQLVTITILATLGGCERQLRLHVRAGLRLGLSPDEIIETIIQVAAYAGAPRASNAVRVAGEVVAAEGVQLR